MPAGVPWRHAFFRRACSWLVCAAWVGAVMMSAPGLRVVLALAAACVRAVVAGAAAARGGQTTGTGPRRAGVLQRTAVPGWQGRVRLIAAGPAREALLNVWCELAAGVLVACAVAVSPLCVVLALCLRTPLRRSAGHAQLAASARTDSKTGLLNYASWYQAAAAELARAARTQCPPSVLMLDLDHFKAVNDRYGHLAGDEALRVVVGILKDQLRQYDLAGRFGGEEFVVLLPHTGVAQALHIAERLRSAVAEARVRTGDARAAGMKLQLTISIGVAVAAAPDLDAVVTAADSACYQAKMAGRNRVRVWSDPGPQTGSAGARRAYGLAKAR
jgi:diguanylate cyclase (GGDEF)-like protein